MGEAKRRKQLDPNFGNPIIRDAQSFAKYVCERREEIEDFLLPFLKECAENGNAQFLI